MGRSVTYNDMPMIVDNAFHDQVKVQVDADLGKKTGRECGQIIIH